MNLNVLSSSFALIIVQQANVSLFAANVSENGAVCAIEQSIAVPANVIVTFSAPVEERTTVPFCSPATVGLYLI